MEDKNEMIIYVYFINYEEGKQKKKLNIQAEPKVIRQQIQLSPTIKRITLNVNTPSKRQRFSD